MKKLLFLITLILATNGVAQDKKSKNEKEAPFVIVELMPQFKGGEEAKQKFIQKNIVYPEKAKLDGITGTCYVTFVVEKNGEITDAKIIRGVPNGAELDKEALRVINMMPKWKPGKQNGKKVRVQYNLPIKFVLK